MRRFYVSPKTLGGEAVFLEGEVAHRMASVLRMSPGDRAVLFDGSGDDIVIRLDVVSRGLVSATVLERRRGTAEPQVQITLFQGTLKGDKLEWVLQKGTEVGVTAFVPRICERSVARPEGKTSSGRMARRNKIILEAAEQCGRSRLPTLSSPVEFREACREAGASGLGLIPWEEAKDASLREVLKAQSSRNVSIFIGPEGGFKEEEVGYARDQGLMPVSLGRRILRAETAGLVAATAVLYESGDLEG